MLGFESSGNFKKTEKFLTRLGKLDFYKILKNYGELGVRALASATPVDSGLTAASWEYEIVRRGNGYSLVWNNTNTKTGVNVAIIIQYGHGTRTGGWVQGRDYINPTIKPIFERIADEIRGEVTNAKH
jgi:hypothetical protein